MEVLYKFYGLLVSLPFCYLGMTAQFMGEVGLENQAVHTKYYNRGLHVDTS